MAQRAKGMAHRAWSIPQLNRLRIPPQLNTLRVPGSTGHRAAASSTGGVNIANRRRSVVQRAGLEVGGGPVGSWG
jgi:hypothetical protein